MPRPLSNPEIEEIYRLLNITFPGWAEETGWGENENNEALTQKYISGSTVHLLSLLSDISLDHAQLKSVILSATHFSIRLSNNLAEKTHILGKTASLTKALLHVYAGYYSDALSMEPNTDTDGARSLTLQKLKGWIDLACSIVMSLGDTSVGRMQSDALKL
ncbi:hypothetical protein SISNIDRAFT_971 [Sistotremastrum niveocremeum HHB9708]|uniref:Uncharacterized protein n=1 Tax=Sistotremastrum niveocremeum HHB9708 TaxID=1314777 RepID=A0A165ACB5_9AGAM|nr:hypothetical protein SISNIDRAFT_971 [Sistotremastrum niveocremeum HHB9708]